MRLSVWHSAVVSANNMAGRKFCQEGGAGRGGPGAARSQPAVIPSVESRDLGGGDMRIEPGAPPTQIPRFTLGMTEKCGVALPVRRKFTRGGGGGAGSRAP